ncbi:MAG: 9-O-acetylesterase, partial [Alphaproteobacteria bacterium]|nr:9-O-acetylesterase [Alphaproteobacteria bacterium]
MKPFRLLSTRQVVVFSGLLLFAAGRVAADVRLPAIIGDGMVLQCDKPVVIWGWAAPGEEVTVAIGGNRATTNADAKGEWMVRLAAMKASAEPVELTVTGASGRKIKRKNVLIGDVWIGSGQSNMERAMESRFNGKPLYEGGDYPGIRLFHTPKKTATAPAADVSARWIQCSPESTRTFSAVLYHFGLHLHTELGVPVGLIESAWAGTPIQPWTPPEGFASEPALAADLEWVKGADDRYEDAEAACLVQFAAWLAKAKLATGEGRPISAPPSWPRHPMLSHRSPTGIYNAMIHPLARFAIRGAIWYQGEDNVGVGMHYHHQLKGLIQGWRQVWKQGDFPFYYVQ